MKSYWGILRQEPRVHSGYWVNMEMPNNGMLLAVRKTVLQYHRGDCLLIERDPTNEYDPHTGSWLGDEIELLEGKRAADVRWDVEVGN